MIIPEENIAVGIKKGDEEAYVFLYKKFYAILCAYSRRFVGRKDVAEEIVADTFFTLWKNRGKTTITGSIHAYLFQATYKNSMYYLRKLEKEKKLACYFKETDPENIGFEISVIEQNEQSLIREDILNKIEVAIEHLPHQQQQAFRLHRTEGKKIREIADLMGISVKTVEMHLSKAMLNLREHLKKNHTVSVLFFIFLK